MPSPGVYAARRLARQCVDCALDLDPHERVRCDDCLEARRTSSRRYQRSRKAKLRRRDRVNRIYREKRASQVCITSGCHLPATAPHVRCAEHHDYYQQARRDSEAARSADVAA